MLDYVRCAKTVFILDHSDNLLQPCGEFMKYDMSSECDSFSKSLWTCNLEATLEYCRIIYDVFAGTKLISLIGCRNNARVINSFSQQSFSQLTSLLNVYYKEAKISKCEFSNEVVLRSAISQAIPLFALDTNRGFKYSEDKSNVCRIVLLTNCEDEGEYSDIGNNLARFLAASINAHNNAAALDNSTLPITSCDLCLIGVSKFSKTQFVTTTTNPLRTSFSWLNSENDFQFRPSSSLVASEEIPLVRYQEFAFTSGQILTDHVLHLACTHYELTRTIVTGIPMKEEQGSGSSSNYDVELLHQLEVHNELIENTKLWDSLVCTNKNLGVELKAVTLKWCTPKSDVIKSDQFSYANMSRVSPVQVNSRPSACLTNFILGGRTVILEIPKKQGVGENMSTRQSTATARITSHMLYSHSGDIYIHANLLSKTNGPLKSSMATFRDIPSITEGLGGKVMDYRIREFDEIAVNSRLTLGGKRVTEDGTEYAIDKALKQSWHLTRYWPLTLSESILHQIACHVPVLITTLKKPVITDAELEACNRAIVQLITMEKKREHLTQLSASDVNVDGVSAPSVKRLSGKRDDQFRQMWIEMEQMLAATSKSSSQHLKMFNNFLKLRNVVVPDPISISESESKRPFSPVDVKKRKAQLDEYCKFLNGGKKVKLSMPSPAKVSLFEMWELQLNAIANNSTLQNSREMAGRLEASGSKSQLYKALFQPKPEDEEMASIEK